MLPARRAVRLNDVRELLVEFTNDVGLFLDDHLVAVLSVDQRG